MLLHIFFTIYLVIFIFTIILGGINYYKIRDKHKNNPDIIVFLIPLIVNFIVAHYVFTDVDPLLKLIFPCIVIFFIGRKLKNVRIFGLTGGIACGKSTLVKEMKSNLPKLHVVDCDQIANNLRKKDHSGYNLIKKLLGQKWEQFIDSNSLQINRQKLSNYVFQNAIFRRQLSSKMGRLIFWQIIKSIFFSICSKRNLIMIDAPILYQSGVLQYFCYPIIVVGCSEEQQILRLQKRNQLSRQAALKRIKAQMPLTIKQKKSDIYIKNQGTQDLLNSTLEKLNKFLYKK